MPFMNNIKELCLVPGKASGDIASFEASAAPLVSCICTLNPVQSGSGDPSPSNVRPITGHTELNLVHTGANIWDEEWENGDIGWSDGQATITDPNKIRSKNFIPIIGGLSYYLKLPTGACNVFYYDENYNHILSGFASGSMTITPPTNACYMKFAPRSAITTYNHDISINYPSTDTSYHAYNGSSHTITFPDTVYGASLDVGTGVLTIDRAIVDLGTIASFSYDSGSKRWQSTITGLYSFPSRNGNLVAEKYVADITASAGDENKMFTVDGAVYIYYTDSTTPPSGNLVYPLATPITTQLTPEQLNSILGDNNFYHDGNGPTDITYIRRMN